MKGNHKKLLLAFAIAAVVAMSATSAAFAYQAQKAEQGPEACPDIAACCENAEEAIASASAADGSQTKACADPESCCADAEQVVKEVTGDEQENRG